ncbi:polysaccharide deacetylase family protein [Priestia flexa]|uniref:polysaccharide deacetylase family protein n=1 Tax=Priestia flexa TaxID=86664 RepID=UPI00211B57D1
MRPALQKPKHLYIGISLALLIFLLLAVIGKYTNAQTMSLAVKEPLAYTPMPQKENSANYANKTLNTLHHSAYLANTLNDRNEPLTKPVFITFDDGPNNDTQKILDTLRDYNVKATFFLLKNQIDRYPDIAKRIVAEGHSVGCHGVSHDIHQMYGKDGAALNEMTTCLNTLKDVTGVDSKLIRVPFGSVPYLKEPHRTQLTSRYQLWDWNIDSEDWALRSAPKIIQSIEPHIEHVNASGQTPVILFHDKPFTAQSLPTILTYLHSNHYQSMTINNTMKPLQFPSHT